MKYLNQANIQRAQVIPLMVKQIQDLVENKGFNDIQAPLRNIIRPEGKSASYGAMMAVSEPMDLFICKAANFIEDNPKKGRTSVHAIVNAFSYETGLPLAVLDGSAITNLKSAAITGYFTNLGAPDDADTLAIIGSGEQAMQQFLGVAAVRSIKRVQIYSRSPVKANQFASHLAEAFPRVQFVVCDTIQEAQSRAQILSTATSCKTCLVESLDPACSHINCMGAFTYTGREVSLDIINTSILLVEDRATAVQEAGFEHTQALDLRSEPEVFNVTLKSKLTLFSSTGHSSLDLVACYHILKQLGDF